jgi:arylsulfatase A-like enzyme
VEGSIEDGLDTQQTRRLYRVPFAVKAPGSGNAQLYDYEAQGIDILPTVLGRVGSAEEVAAYAFDGVDVLRERPERRHYFTLQDRDNVYRFRDNASETPELVAIPVENALEEIHSAQ